MKLSLFFISNRKEDLEIDKNIILKELARKLPETEGISYELQNDKLKVKVGEDNEKELEKGLRKLLISIIQSLRDDI